MDIASWWSLGTLLGLALLLHWVPRLTRPELFFGVTVAAGFRDSAEGRRLTRMFRWGIWLVAAAGSAAIVTGRVPETRFGAAVLWLTAMNTVGWYWIHRKARAYAVRSDSRREADLTTGAPRLPGSWLVKLGPYMILGAVALNLHQNYESLPDPFPVHWNIRGEADRFVAKTPSRVMQLPAAGLVICGGMALAAFSIARHSRRISIRGGSGVRESKFRDMNLRLLLGAQYYVACIFGWISFVLGTSDPPALAQYVLVAMAVLPLPAALYLSVKYGQGGSRLGGMPTSTLGLLEADAAARPVGDRTPDACWKFGQIYYNPDDAAVWVEKRAGVGYTVNFARPAAWLMLALIVLGPLLVVGLMEGGMAQMTKRSFLCLQLGWLCSGTASAEDVEDARGAVERWLAIHDQGRYDAAWDATAEMVKSKVSKEQWVQSMQAVLPPFGKLESRTLRSSRATDSLPGAPDGKYVIFEYDARFEKKGAVIETIIPMLEGGEWKVMTYRVR